MTAKTSLILALGALALAGCGMTARPPAPVGQPVSAAPKDRLVAAIEAEDCLLTSANVGAVLLRANLTQAELVTLTPELAAEGRAEVSGEGTIRVLSNNCI